MPLNESLAGLALDRCSVSLSCASRADRCPDGAFVMVKRPTIAYDTDGAAGFFCDRVCGVTLHLE